MGQPGYSQQRPPELRACLPRAVAGTPKFVRGVIDGLEARDVSTFVINMPGHADKLGTMRRVAKLMGKS